MKEVIKEMEYLIKEFEIITFINGGKLNEDDVKELRKIFEKLKDKK